MVVSRVFRSQRVGAGARRYRAVWNHAVLADSADTVLVDGNPYFRFADVRAEYLRPSECHTTGPWKGVAIHYDVAVGDRVNADAARYYPNPGPAAARIRGRVAFRSGVTVEAVAE